ncbi:HemK2/MTQ2 family protein methyltransferase [Gordonia zhaorongruii]|uniref:HemK2/MTQ2 family protein methyltransferase n=1 Tax=Gordonia zhaorongruii TaxID=2597659 RepID=UPI00104A0001|nr:HemK2/MTQ2 family protein methyltransferase [Gordonia zhaorongruii]
MLAKGASAATASTDQILAQVPIERPRIAVKAGVYAPAVDSAMLCRRTVAEVLASPIEHPRVIELCAGSGIASVYAARAGARVTAVDDARGAIETVKANASANGVSIDVVDADVGVLPALAPADLVITNPPYVPAPDSATDGHAWNAGPDGRKVVDAVISRLPQLVRPGGVVIIVHSTVTGTERTLADLRALGFDTAISDEESLEFGPVMTGRARWLEDQGLIEAGQRTERLVAIRAVRAGAE